MDYHALIIGFLLGAMLAGIVVTLMLRARLARARSEALARALQLEALAKSSDERHAEVQKRMASADQKEQALQAEIRGLHAQNAQGFATLKGQETIAGRVPELEIALKSAQAEQRQSQRELTEFKEREATFNARIEEFKRAQQELKSAFSALSVEALQKNNEMFLQLAKTEFEKTQTAGSVELEKKRQTFEELVKPIKEGLDKYDERISKLDKDRMEVYGKLTSELEAVKLGNKTLRDETLNLVNALRTPNTRGQWGEVQLRRVVELAGMLEHCDFNTQVSSASENGSLRPDMTVRMPGGKTIVVDSKVPLKAYLEAFESTDDAVRKIKFIEHAAQLRKHVDSLSAKEYWGQFGSSPEFVFMFLPRESVYYAAMEHAPALFEDAVQRRVIIATPATLIVLLRSINFGWRQESIAENAQLISETGRELYRRMQKFADHFSRVGKGLEGAVKAYNEAAGSMEKRVLTQARRFKELGASEGEELSEAKEVEVRVHELNSPDLKSPG